MIYLDGNWYETEGDSEQAELGTFTSHARTETGTLIVFQTPIVENTRSYQLLLTKAQLLRLRVTVAKVGALDFVDHENFGWHPNAGTDDALNAYDTGTYFPPNFRLVARPLEGSGWHDCNRFLAEVQLVVNARELLTYD